MENVFLGTDAAVTLSIFGTLGEILNMPLTSSLTSKNPFEQNQLDKFTLRNKSIGKVIYSS